MAVIIRVGYETRRLGTIEATPTGIVVRADTPEDEADLEGIVRELRSPGQTDDAALRDIPRQLNNGYYWARDVADEPLYWPDGAMNAEKARWLEAEYPQAAQEESVHANTVVTAAESVALYDPNQARDSHGRWTPEGHEHEAMVSPRQHGAEEHPEHHDHEGSSEERQNPHLGRSLTKAGERLFPGQGYFVRFVNSPQHAVQDLHRGHSFHGYAFYGKRADAEEEAEFFGFSKHDVVPMTMHGQVKYGIRLDGLAGFGPYETVEEAESEGRRRQGYNGVKWPMFSVFAGSYASDAEDGDLFHPFSIVKHVSLNDGSGNDSRE